MSNIRIERKGDNGFEIKDMTIDEALPLLNNDLANEMTIWIDGRPYMDKIITSDILSTCRKEISVTNRLVGG